MTELTLPPPASCIAALLAMVLPPPPLPLIGMKDDTRSTNTNNSPATLAHAVFRALKARALLDWPLPAGFVGSKDGKGNCSNEDGTKLSHAPDQDDPPLPPPQVAEGWQQGWWASEVKGNKEGDGNRMRVVSDNNGDSNGGKSDGNGNKGGGQATKTRAMVATIVAGNYEGKGNGNEGGGRQRG